MRVFKLIFSIFLLSAYPNILSAKVNFNCESLNALHIPSIDHSNGPFMLYEDMNVVFQREFGKALFSFSASDFNDLQVFILQCKNNNYSEQEYSELIKGIEDFKYNIMAYQKRKMIENLEETERLKNEAEAKKLYDEQVVKDKLNSKLDSLGIYFGYYYIADFCEKNNVSFTEEEVANLRKQISAIADSSEVPKSLRDRKWADVQQALSVKSETFSKQLCVEVKQQLFEIFPSSFQKPTTPNPF